MTLQHQKWKLPVAWRFERNINLTPCSSHRRTPSHTAKGTAELGRRGKLPPVPAKDDQPRVCHEGECWPALDGARETGDVIQRSGAPLMCSVLTNQNVGVALVLRTVV
jgi:hypothetical protein